MQSISQSISKLSLVALLLSLCAPAFAVDYHWNAPVSGVFNDPDNWQPAAVPGLLDTVSFDLSSPGYTVNTTGVTQVDKLSIGNDTLTISTFALSATQSVQLGLKANDVANLTLFGSLGGKLIEIGSAAGSQSTTTIGGGGVLTTSPLFVFNPPPGQMVVGGAGSGTLHIGSGSVSSNGTLVIARDAGSVGAVTLNSMGGRLQAIGSGLIVGQGGKGSLDLSAGTNAEVAGTVKVGLEADSEGSISLSGSSASLSAATTGSSPLTSATIGQSGKGSLSITDGANARLAGPLVFGENAGSQGTLLIDGLNSFLAPIGSGSPAKLGLAIGGKGKAEATVAHGATAELGDKISIGRDAGGEGTLTITDSGSRLRSAGFGNQQINGLYVGDGGNGTLNLLNGGAANVTNSFVVVGDDAGSQGAVNVSGYSSILFAGQLAVGNAGSGKLAVTTGGIVQAGASTIGSLAGSVGEVTASGAQSQLTFDSLTVGKSGTGSFKATSALTKIAKALVVGEAAGSVGSVTFEGAGPGTTFGPLTVGSSGKGTFNLTGALASTTEVAILAQAQGSEGVMNVSGSASNFFINPNSGNFSIGQRGTGELNITAGGLVGTSSSKMKVILGEFAGSKGTVNVDGPQSSLTLQSGQDPGQPSLVIGQGGTGTFNVTGGAKISTGSFFLGYNSGPAAAGNGSLTLDGAGTELNAFSSGLNPTIIGSQTTGKISITNGAKLATGPSYLGYQRNGVGTAEVDGTGSRWISAQALELGVNGGVGNLSITNGGTVSVVTTSVTNNRNSTIEIQNGTLDAFVYNFGTIENNGSILGGVNNSGVLSGSGTIAGKVTQWGGTLAPGNSPGTLALGALEINSGTFELEMNSASGIAGGLVGWDLVAVQGATSINGNSVIDLITLMQNNTAGNVFDFDPLQNYQWTFLTAGGGIQGFNPNQFSVLTDNFDNPFDGSFFVSQSGNALVLNYAVPEPSSLLLALLGIAAIAAAKARQKQAPWNRT